MQPVVLFQTTARMSTSCIPTPHPPNTPTSRGSLRNGPKPSRANSSPIRIDAMRTRRPTPKRANQHLYPNENLDLIRVAITERFHRQLIASVARVEDTIVESTRRMPHRRVAELRCCSCRIMMALSPEILPYLQACGGVCDK